MSDLQRIKAILPANFQDHDIAQLALAVDDISVAHSVFHEIKTDRTSPWVIEWIAPSNVPLADVKSRLFLTADLNDLDLSDLTWTAEPIGDENWLEQSYQQFPPFDVGDFFIYGSHYDGDVPKGKTGLQIDAATAFGSGEHSTTEGCLRAMQDLFEQGVCPWNILDMGCGSGILALAAWRLWKAPILGIDIEEESIKVSNHHRHINHISGLKGAVTFECGNGFLARSVDEKKPYELIIANILAGPLIEMARDLVYVLDDNGYVILSGLLNEQRDDVLKAYQNQGLVLRDEKDIEGWSTLVLHKPFAER